MLNITKSYVVDENQQPIAVQIPIAEFERIEKILKKFDLTRFLEATEEHEKTLNEMDIEDEPYDWLPGELGSGKPVKYIDGVGLVIVDK
ncbi:hypothetical protein PN499_21410 [Kamptonema animale CS-326]|uniref:hypothetical protein n=1 Tax=Kamptonema animale TaxID=92934 RepID=UPI00232BACA5|nr:hypothetical protein [Kamptonema animale]MDB9513759.1 hypothetical protein [Kamptonema animale CS-326]